MPQNRGHFSQQSEARFRAPTSLRLPSPRSEPERAERHAGS